MSAHSHMLDAVTSPPRSGADAAPAPASDRDEAAGHGRSRAAALPPDERRAAIVAATLPLLLAHGARVTTRQIAEAAGIAEGTIFRVFPDKESLIEAAIETAFDPAPIEAALRAIDPSLPLEARLVRGGRDHPAPRHRHLAADDRRRHDQAAPRARPGSRNEPRRLRRARRAVRARPRPPAPRPGGRRAAAPRADPRRHPPRARRRASPCPRPRSCRCCSTASAPHPPPRPTATPRTTRC